MANVLGDSRVSHLEIHEACNVAWGPTVDNIYQFFACTLPPLLRYQKIHQNNSPCPSVVGLCLLTRHQLRVRQHAHGFDFQRFHKNIARDDIMQLGARPRVVGQSWRLNHSPGSKPSLRLVATSFGGFPHQSATCPCYSNNLTIFLCGIFVVRYLWCMSMVVILQTVESPSSSHLSLLLWCASQNQALSLIEQVWKLASVPCEVQ